jgi:hypothetical protein
MIFSMDDEVGATKITAETAIELVKEARKSMAVNHMHFVDDDGSGSSQASFTCNEQAYQLTYEYAHGKITELEIEGPDKDGEKRVVVQYPSTTTRNAEKDGKSKEVATPTHHSSSVSAPTASVADTIPVTAHHSDGPVYLMLPAQMKSAKLTKETVWRSWWTRQLQRWRRSTRTSVMKVEEAVRRTSSETT